MNSRDATLTSDESVSVVIDVAINSPPIKSLREREMASKSVYPRCVCLLTIDLMTLQDGLEGKGLVDRTI